MYLGRIVELSEAAQLYSAPQHPYTQALLDGVPKLSFHGNIGVTFKPIRGELPSPLSPPAGCAFHPRCLMATDLCRTVRPTLDLVDGESAVACHHK
jgi:peptide/nickel transport system ATP-binding protein